MARRKRSETPVDGKVTLGRLFHDEMADPFVRVAMDGAILEFNDTYRDMLGYTADELRRMTYADLTPAKWHAYEARIVREQILATGSSCVYEKEYRRKDGAIIPVELRTFLLRGADGTAEGMWAIVRDISVRKREREQLESAMSKLRDANQRLHFYFERLPLAHIVWDPDFRVREWNPTAERIFGWSADEAIGRHPNDLIVPEDVRTKVMSLWRNIVRGRKVVSNINENVTRDGRRIVVEWFNDTLLDEKGAMVGCISMAHDITERIRVEDKIKALNADLERRVSERTEALTQTVSALKKEGRRRERAEKGRRIRQEQLIELVSQLIVAESGERRRIADGLHDDVNQMLAAAKLMTGKIGQGCGKSMRKSVQELDGMLDDVLKKTRSLTFDLASPVLQRLGFKAAVEDLCDRFRRTEAIDVEYVADSRDRRLDPDVEDFAFRSLKELLNNVKRHARAKRVAVSLRWVRGGMEVSVEDDGIGPVGIKKSRFSHTGGFGLYTIRERLDYLGGWMRVGTAEDGGTRITLRLPLAPRARRQRSMTAEAGSVTTPTLVL